jgi:hypothetical protein
MNLFALRVLLPLKMKLDKIEPPAKREKPE